jgi:uncharacterized protein YbaA (DUF1428 family)
MAYIDGFVAAVPNARRQEYLDYAKKFDALFIKHGALSAVETWEDDVPDGKLTSFALAVKREEGESILFSWIKWPSKQVRTDAWERMMKLPEMQPGASPMPFDGKRMIFGGFEVMLEL